MPKDKCDNIYSLATTNPFVIQARSDTVQPCAHLVNNLFGKFVQIFNT